MSPEKAKSVGDILAGMKGAPEKESGTDIEEAAEGDTEGKMLSDAIYDALQGRDREGFHEALEAYMVYCLKEPPHEEEEGPKSEPGAAKPGGLAIILGKH